MKLSSRQRRMLKAYRGFRNDPPTMLRLISLSAVTLAIPTMFVVVGIAISAAAGIEDFSIMLFLAGMALGMLTRDFGNFRLTEHVWPVFRLIIDWKKVDGLLTDVAGNQTATEIQDFV